MHSTFGCAVGCKIGIVVILPPTGLVHFQKAPAFPFKNEEVILNQPFFFFFFSSFIFFSRTRYTFTDLFSGSPSPKKLCVADSRLLEQTENESLDPTNDQITELLATYLSAHHQEGLIPLNFAPQIHF